MKISNIEYNFIICPEQETKVIAANSFSSVYILKSLCKVTVEEEIYRVFPDCVLFVPPNKSVTIQAKGAPVYIDSFCWEGAIPEKLKDYLFIDDIRCNELSAIIKTMKTEDLQERELKADILAHYAEIFFLMTERTATEKKNRKKVHPFYQLREDIYNQPHKKWDISEIISQSGLSKRQFYYSYRAVFDTSIKQDIIASRMDYAKYLLLNTDMRITQIAQSCCYNSDQHFVQSFTKYFGVSPTQYRFNFLRFHTQRKDIIL